jgi:hypothetical protein
VSEKGTVVHRHECPLCGAGVRCTDRLPHYVGLRLQPEIRLHGIEREQRFKVCTPCARREKGLKEKVGGDVALLSQLIERGVPFLNAVDVLAEAYIARERRLARAALDQRYGQTKGQARRLALRDYARMRQLGERDAALTVMRRYPLAAFPSVRAVAQAAHRRRRHPKSAR